MASQTSITPPPLQPALPTAKEKKYDRQLRLWAASGQAALEEARVLLLNSGPGVVGIEALKNLILPGVGSYTIVDGAIVAEKDLGVNFFLTDESLGKSRAIETSAYLGELNPEVKSQGINKVGEALVLLFERFLLLRTISVYRRIHKSGKMVGTIYSNLTQRTFKVCRGHLPDRSSGICASFLHPLNRLLLPFLRPTPRKIPRR